MKVFVLLEESADYGSSSKIFSTFEEAKKGMVNAVVEQWPFHLPMDDSNELGRAFLEIEQFINNFTLEQFEAKEVVKFEAGEFVAGAAHDDSYNLYFSAVDVFKDPGVHLSITSQETLG